MPAIAPGAGKTQGERGHLTCQAKAGRLLCTSPVGTRGKDREQRGGKKGGEGSASRRDHHFMMPMAETFTGGAQVWVRPGAWADGGEDEGTVLREGTVSLDFTVFLLVLESLERMLGVAFAREVRQEGPWLWELFRVSERTSGEEDGGLRSSNWEQEADLCCFLPWALGVWEPSSFHPGKPRVGMAQSLSS